MTLKNLVGWSAWTESTEKLWNFLKVIKCLSFSTEWLRWHLQCIYRTTLQKQHESNCLKQEKKSANLKWIRIMSITPKLSAKIHFYLSRFSYWQYSEFTFPQRIVHLPKTFNLSQFHWNSYRKMSEVFQNHWESFIFCCWFVSVLTGLYWV